MDNEKVPENPPAFPCRNNDYIGTESYLPGMTLRDWFAGQALAGFCGSQWFADHGHGPDAGIPQNLTRNAYEMADAMLAARKEDSHAG